MNDLFHKILIHLYEVNGLNQRIDITEFLKKEFHPNANSPEILKLIVDTIGHLGTSKYIERESLPHWGKKINYVFHTLDTDTGNATLTLLGHDYIAAKIREIKQHDLLEKQTDAIEQTNKSTLKLNEEDLPKNFKSQRIFGYGSLGLTAISVIFIAITTYQQCKDSTAQQLQELKQEVKKTSKAFDSIQFYLKGINNSLQNIKTDTMLNKQQQ